MVEKPKVFISFSQRDQSQVKKLFAALEIQGVYPWDYSDEGQELRVAHAVRSSLEAKIDSCQHFIAVISPNSIDELIAPTPIFEVRYAINSGKHKRNELLPLLLNDPGEQWLTTYRELAPLLRVTFNPDDRVKSETTLRQICDWLGRPYKPTLLLDERVFFGETLLQEIDQNGLENADFANLIRCMNSAAHTFLAQDKNHNETWKIIKQKAISFLSEANDRVGQLRFYYPQVLKGVAELQLQQFEEAEQTFLNLTMSDGSDRKPIGLGFAGLGHTYFSISRFEDSLKAFEKATGLLPGDNDVQVNCLGARVHAGEAVVDDTVLSNFDESKLSPEHRIKFLTLKGCVRYWQEEYRAVVEILSALSPDDLNETSATYYAMALEKEDQREKQIEVLEDAAHRIQTPNLYHHLARAYLGVGSFDEALWLYKNVLYGTTHPAAFARQVLVEYAQLIRVIEGSECEKFRDVCERAVNFTLLAPPQSKPDFFFTGFAFYLLGKEELARFYHRCSDGFATDYYDQLELTTRDFDYV